MNRKAITGSVMARDMHTLTSESQEVMLGLKVIVVHLTLELPGVEYP